VKPVTRILLNPLVQDATRLAVQHGRLSAIPTNGGFDQLRVWEIAPYEPATIDLDPPQTGTAWRLVLTIGAAVTTRVVTFTGTSVDWDHLTDVDPDSLEPIPAGPAIPIWDAVKADLLDAVQQAREDLDGYLEAHIMDHTPHAVYDDMPDLTLLFENKVVTGIVDDEPLPDLSTVFNTAI
jgi:hypothetical protein